MRKLVAASLVALMASSSVIFAAEELEQSTRPLATSAAREAMRVAKTSSALRQTPAGQSAPEPERWMERHPVWFGLIVGAGIGASWGALTCREGCFPLNAGGAAMVGSWWGAGPGALIGWAVGRSQ